MSEQIKKGSLGAILLASQIINETDISIALEEQKKTGVRFGEALLNLGIVTQEDIDWALSNQLDLPYIRLKIDMIDPDAVKLIPAAMARKFNLIPLIKAGGELNIAIADPLNKPAVEAVEQHSGCTVNISVALIREIREMIDACYGRAGQENLGFESETFAEKALDAVNGDLSGANLLDYLLIFILQNRLSSLSLQPLGDSISVSGRRSGVSRPVGTLASNYYPDIAMKIRKSAGMCQSGDACNSGMLTFSYHSHPITFQVVMMAGYGGDYITIKPHVAASVPARLSELQLPAHQESCFKQLACSRQGITFFASRNTLERDSFIDLMLEEIDTSGKNVIILGEGLCRMNKHFPKIKLPVGETERAGVIMSALDHAPDILVIENITEAMPFAAACLAAMRGKLVLAGLEIRGTRKILQQLLQYQQKNYFMPIFANGLVSFKGIQILCPECRTNYSPSAEELVAIHLSQPPESFYRTTGCEACGHSGFSKRRFLLDVLKFDGDFLQVFEQTSDVAALEEYLQTSGYQGIAEEGLQLLNAGEVSPEEYIASVIL